MFNWRGRGSAGADALPAVPRSRAFFKLDCSFSRLLQSGLISLSPGVGAFDVSEMNPRDVKRAMKRFYSGVALAVVSVLCQVLNEMFCSKNEFMKRFPGHAIWHVGMACASRPDGQARPPSPQPAAPMASARASRRDSPRVTRQMASFAVSSWRW